MASHIHTMNDGHMYFIFCIYKHSFNNNDNHGSGQSVFILILILCVQMRSSRKITINDYMIPSK